VKKVRFTRLAWREVNAAAKFFEGRKEGLGLKFHDRVDEAADKIKLNPEGFQKLYKDMRHVNLEQFKDWGLFFRIRDDDSIVIACVSGGRHPSLKHKRAAGVIEFPKPQ